MKPKETKTEVLFCTDCSFISNESVILEKKAKSINVHGKEIHGWVVKIAVSATDGPVPLGYTRTEEVE
ncbi:MAG: hypothetical protein KAT86_01570 [Candidatus Latescibacteria bacterium]|nr:hypothetical protein [Candidatus Latescibacterota bacterium]